MIYNVARHDFLKLLIFMLWKNFECINEPTISFCVLYRLFELFPRLRIEKKTTGRTRRKKKRKYFIIIISPHAQFAFVSENG